MPTAPRALIVGIDGGTFDVIDPLVAQGHLPNIAALLESSASARTVCTWPAHTAPGWSSFVSASDPGNHGIFQFYDTQDADYGARLTRSGDLGRSSAWDWLAAQDWSLGLVNIPMSHPPIDRPGYEVSWPLEQTLRHCRPASLLRELAAAKAHFQSDLATMYRGDLGYLDDAERNVAARVRSVRELMRARPTDLVMVVLTEADRVGHHYWHFGDPAHPRNSPVAPGSGWDEANNRIYQAMDQAVGELVSLVDEDTVVVLVSDHGLGAGRYGFAVHTVLEEAGLLATEAGDQPQDGAASWFADHGRRVDFTRTQVYLPVPGSYSLNVNLRARQRNGIVAPRDRERVLAEVTELLADVTTPEGDRVFDRILMREEAYPGSLSNRAPDLLLIPRDESVLPIPELVGGLWQPSVQTGMHRHQGIWAQRSPRCRPGRLDERVPLVDTMPTLLADLNAAWPDDIDGRVRAEVFHDEPATAARLVLATAATPDYLNDAPTATEEDGYTSSRLREMGYL